MQESLGGLGLDADRGPGLFVSRKWLYVFFAALSATGSSEYG